MNNLLGQYLSDYQLISERQFGFRSGLGVDEALFTVSRDLTDLLDQRQKGILITLDLAKAFDSIDRDMLMGSLGSIGVQGSELDWFRNYLDERRQVTVVDGVCSDAMVIDYGVVQGSTLGPILFSIFINGVTKLELNGSLYLFADDTALIARGNTWEEAFLRAGEDMNILYKWFSLNSLSLNITKTKYLAFSRSRGSEVESYSIQLHKCRDPMICSCPSLERVQCIRYLGVWLDDCLKWHTQVSSLAIRLKKFIYVFYSLRRHLSTQLLVRVYKALVQSVISFGIIAWGGATSRALNPLRVMQRTLLKIILRKPPRYSSNLLFSDLPVFSVDQLYVKSALCFYHKNPNCFSVSQLVLPYALRPSVVSAFPSAPSNLISTNRHIYFSLAILLRNTNVHLQSPSSYSRNQYKRHLFTWLIEVGPTYTESLFTSIYKL